MKKLIISSGILSFITIIPFFYYEILEINSENWMFIPFLFIAVSLLYCFFGGIIGILFFNFDPSPKIKEKDYKVEKYISSGSYSQKSVKKSHKESSNNYLTSYFIMSSIDTNNDN